ncbi:DUF6266 family protein [Mariniflexile litorale]|uniref:DUF6266 family protein n=1 Tax=Mariniflexile litorale TaxID=3045158 RepID=A0AAU7EE01_9FLAO|nr:DUF6266 family protein [Mariniflexile sp. KMM 9835]MDQ8212291.1 DUF6266 family protein [Mariniflexile sp. KMM 9835]
MATYNQGVLGGFSGKVGPVIGSNWRGKNVMRSIPSKSTKTVSAAQQLQRDKFKFVLQFLTPLKGVLTETFGANVGSKTPFNNAMSYHMKEAVTYTGTQFEIDYSKVLIGMGGLCGIKNPIVQGAGTTAWQLTWDDNSQQGLAYPHDALLVVAYAPTLNDFDFFMAYSVREEAGCALHFQEAFYGETLQLWATFSNAPLALTATSQYLGSFVV